MKSTGLEMKASMMGMAARTILVVAAICARISSAGAVELEVPQAHPEVAMDIPDSWTIDKSATGFEMRSPEKNSIIIGRTLGRDKAAVEAWRKEAAAKLQAFGIKFDTGAKAPSHTAEAAEPQAKRADSTSANNAPKDGKPADKKQDRTSAFTTDPDLFTFSGAPSLKTPGAKGSNDPVAPGDLSVEALTGFGTTLTGGTGQANMPKLPFHAVQILDATMNNKPVDVQLLIYTLPANRLFVMMQESGSDDGRAVAVARSVRGVK